MRKPEWKKDGRLQQDFALIKKKNDEIAQLTVKRNRLVTAVRVDFFEGDNAEFQKQYLEWERGQA